MLAYLPGLEELQVRKGPTDILADLLVRSSVIVFLALSKEVRVVITAESSSQRVDFSAVNPKVSPLDSGSEPSMLQQDLLHPFPYVLVHPVERGLVALASRAHIPPVVPPRLHEFEETHEVQAAQ